MSKRDDITVSHFPVITFFTGSLNSFYTNAISRTTKLFLTFTKGSFQNITSFTVEGFNISAREMFKVVMNSGLREIFEISKKRN